MSDSELDLSIPASLADIEAEMKKFEDMRRRVSLGLYPRYLFLSQIRDIIKLTNAPLDSLRGMTHEEISTLLLYAMDDSGVDVLKLVQTLRKAREKSDT